MNSANIIINSPEELERLMRGTRRNKYGAIRTEYEGVKYDSKAEAEYAARLEIARKAGAIRRWDRQVTFPLGPDHRYRCDFVVTNNDGTRFAVDCKGVETRDFKRHRRLWAKYGAIPLHIYKVKKDTEIIEPACNLPK